MESSAFPDELVREIAVDGDALWRFLGMLLGAWH